MEGDEIVGRTIKISIARGGVCEAESLAAMEGGKICNLHCSLLHGRHMRVKLVGWRQPNLNGHLMTRCRLHRWPGQVSCMRELQWAVGSLPAICCE